MEYLSYKIEEINGVTDYEYALILAQIEDSMEESKKFNCYHCKNKHKGRDNWKETSFKERTIKGCFDATAKYKLDNIVYSYCIGNYCLPSTSELFSLFVEFEKGVLPHAGGLLDQPAKTIQLFNIINARREEKKEKENSKTDTQRRVEAKLARKKLRDGKRNQS